MIDLNWPQIADLDNRKARNQVMDDYRSISVERFGGNAALNGKQPLLQKIAETRIRTGRITRGEEVADYLCRDLFRIATSAVDRHAFLAPATAVTW